jgi:hypothetical protein
VNIKITAIHREGLQGVHTPNTLWPSAAPVTVEVLEQDESPARAPGVAFDGMKIGRTELAQLRLRHGLVVQGVDQSNAVEMAAQLAEAHRAHAEEVLRLKGINEQQAIEIARLKPFEARCVEQEQTIGELRARIARLSGNGGGKQQTQPQR